MRRVGYHQRKHFRVREDTQLRYAAGSGRPKTKVKGGVTLEELKARSYSVWLKINPRESSWDEFNYLFNKTLPKMIS